MYKVPAHLRARVAALGELSRPLGEARAAALARELATNVIADVAAGRDPEPTIDAWIERIARAIAGRPRVRPVKDLLPEVG